MLGAKDTKPDKTEALHPRSTQGSKVDTLVNRYQ